MTITKPATKALTMLVWSASDNDLYDAQLRDLDRLERVGGSADLNVVAQYSLRRPGQSNSVRRLELHKDDREGLQSPVRAEVGDVSMSNPKALADFITWAKKSYPAEHYWLVISDHGDGWKGACQDDSHQGWMKTAQIDQALTMAEQQTGSKLDILSFDACYMGSAEVAHELHSHAGILIASPEEEGWNGLPYPEVLSDPTLAPRELAKKIIRLSAEHPEDYQTLSAIDLEKIPAVTRSFQNFNQKMRNSKVDISKAIRDSQKFWRYRDLSDLTVKAALQDPSLAEEALAVQKAVSQAIIAEQHDSNHPDAHGLQIGVEEDSDYTEFNLRYADIQFGRETGWDQIVAKQPRQPPE